MLDISAFLFGLIAVAGSALTLVVAFRLGVNPAQKALIDALRDTVGAQRERIAVLEAEVRQLREERDRATARADALEKRIAKLENLIVNKFLALSSEQIDRLLAEEQAA